MPAYQRAASPKVAAADDAVSPAADEARFEAASRRTIKHADARAAATDHASPMTQEPPRPESASDARSAVPATARPADGQVPRGSRVPEHASKTGTNLT